MNSTFQIYENVLIYIPASGEWIKKWLDDFFEDDLKSQEFIILVGQKNYSLLSKKSGIPGGDEYYWIENLSSRLKLPVFSVWTHADIEENIHKWEGGKVTETYWEDFFEFSKNIGIYLPGKPDLPTPPVHSVCLIEGVMLKSISPDIIKKYDYLEIVANKIGTFFYGKGMETYEIYYELMDFFPKAIIYEIRVSQEGLIRIVVSRGWEDIGKMYFPSNQLFESNLNTIKGESEFIKIVTALDIPLKYFGLETNNM